MESECDFMESECLIGSKSALKCLSHCFPDFFCNLDYLNTDDSDLLTRILNK